MKVIYKIADNIISSLGINTAENMAAINWGESGISYRGNEFGIPEPFHASVVPFERVDEYFGRIANIEKYTDFERLIIVSAHDAIIHSNINPASGKTLFVISTTKGNISLLDPDKGKAFEKDRVNLWASANEIASFFKNPNNPVVVSQACISGVSALLAAKMYLESGKYEHVVVTGGDILSKFVVAGFQSFKAISPTRCRPFDVSRDGLSLGEGAGTIILGTSVDNKLPGNSIVIKAGSTSNDANHISGPSRTGEGLFRAINNTLKGQNTSDIAFINAHGTATPFNDEMEAVAISRANLDEIPVNSFKGYFGHTLGAAGLIETIVCSHSLQDSQYVQSLGFKTLGVSKNIKIISEAGKFQGTECLKMASGFGGCNAVIHLKKYN
jgi:3-oxoacyl-[acyl-carrier-protein] synthase I